MEPPKYTHRRGDDEDDEGVIQRYHQRHSDSEILQATDYKDRQPDRQIRHLESSLNVNTAVTLIVVGVLGWVGTTLVGVTNSISALQAKVEASTAIDGVFTSRFNVLELRVLELERHSK